MSRRRVSSCWSVRVQWVGLRPRRGTRTPARMGAITASRPTTRAVIVQMACGGAWSHRLRPGLTSRSLPRSSLEVVGGLADDIVPSGHHLDLDSHPSRHEPDRQTG
jgi:hypothetical protein